MKFSGKHWLKEYLSFSKKDRNAVIILSILILLALMINVLVDHLMFNSGHDYTENKRILEEWQNRSKNSKNKIENTGESMFLFNPNSISKEKLDSLLLPEFVKRNLLNYRAAGGKFSTVADVRKIYGMNDSIFEAIESYIRIPQGHVPVPFSERPRKNTYSGFIDPNKAGKEELIQFGFTDFQAGNIVGYRNKGGRFEIPSDILKIYGLDSTLYVKIEPHIRIEPSSERSSPKDEFNAPLILVELNSADTASLKKLEGVGSVFASRVLKYRDLLGGFNRKEQLLEVYNFTEETFLNIRNNITVDTTGVQKMRLNFASFEQLLRHPYLTKKDVEAILDYRNQNGSYTSVNQILEKKLVDSTTYYLILPYLDCR